MPKISASVLSADFAKLGEEAAAVERDGADAIHVDVLDGHFAPNISFGVNAVKVARKFSRLPVEVHFMVSGEEFLTHCLIPEAANAGADVIIVHPEVVMHLDRMLNYVRGLGKKAGVALNPSTSLSAITHVLDILDYILIMTVNPGFSGQNFIEAMVQKIADCHTMITGYNIDLAVDGGMREDTSRKARDAGAGVIVAGSAIFEHNIKTETDYVKAIDRLRR